MAWSYSGDPSTTPKDAVRFEAQDVNGSAPLLQDAEISYVIVAEAGVEPAGGYTQANILSAAAHCCEDLVTRFSYQADTEVGSLKLTYSKMAQNLLARAKSLRARAQGLNAPWVGGQSVSWKVAYAGNSDQVQPAFQRDQWNVPWAGESPGGYLPDDLGPPIGN